MPPGADNDKTARILQFLADGDHKLIEISDAQGVALDSSHSTSSPCP